MHGAVRRLPVTTGCPAFERLDVGDIRVYDARFPDHLRLTLHAHERTSFGVVLEGALDVELRSGRHECAAGTVETKPAGEPHANRFGRAGARVLVIEPGPGTEDMLRNFTDLLASPRCFADGAALALAHRVALELRRSDDVTPLAVEGLVLELLACTTRRVRARPPRRRPAWLDTVRELLHERFRDPLRVQTVAREAGVHPAYLARTFRTHFGTSMGGYVRGLRLGWAAERLRGRASIAAIAVEAGFPDQSSFTRAFRNWAGTTPGVFRKRAGKI